MYYAVRQRRSIDHRKLAEVAVCVTPGLGALALGYPRAGAWLFFCTLGLFLLHHLLVRDRLAFLTLAIATIPVMMLLRSAFFYSSVIGILAAAVVVWIVAAEDPAPRFPPDPVVGWLLGGTVFYWLLSFAMTGQYDVNSRALELSLSAVSLYLLGSHRSLLATALTGIFLSTTAMSLALLPFGGRLGQVSFEDVAIGNPISLGTPAALILLLAVADGGRWLLAPTTSFRGILLMLFSAVVLLLSTSRGSWLVVLVGFALIFVMSRRSRKALAAAAVLVTVVVAVVLQSSRGGMVSRYVSKVFSAERSASQRTSGRSEQWAALPLMLRDSPIWGFGPGSERRVAYRYTQTGRTMHSLYLHVVAETGLLGLGALALLLRAAIGRGVRHNRLVGEIAPLTAGAGFLTIGLTVSAFDAISGVYLGLAILGTRQPVFRLAVRPAAEPATFVVATR